MELQQYAKLLRKELLKQNSETAARKVCKEVIFLICKDLFSHTEIAKALSAIGASDSSPTNDIDFIKVVRSIHLQEMLNDPEQRKNAGSFYTPTHVIEAVVQGLQSRWGISQKDVLDPTMGAGDFLEVWFRLNKSSNHLRFFTNNIFGIDTNPRAVLAARLIFLFILGFSRKSCKAVVRNLICQDFLRPLKTNESLLLPLQKFSNIVGNPPYVVSDVSDYPCRTNKTRNLFGPITEHATMRLKQGGHLAFILPISVNSAGPTSALRGVLESELKEIVYATFASRPMKLFEGVDQRVTILFGKKSFSKNPGIYSSLGYLKWNTKAELIERLAKITEGVYLPALLRDGGIWPKIANKSEVGIATKVMSEGNSVRSMLSKGTTKFPVYYFRIARYYVKSLDSLPAKTSDTTSSEIKCLYAKDRKSQLTLIAILNSDLFYWWWTISGDCFHVGQQLIKDLSIPNLDDGTFKSIETSVTELLRAMKRNCRTETLGNSKVTRIEMRDCSGQLERVSRSVNRLFSLSKNEQTLISDYVINSRGSDAILDEVG